MAARDLGSGSGSGSGCSFTGRQGEAIRLMTAARTLEQPPALERLQIF
jgi:hypothetical protein